MFYMESDSGGYVNFNMLHRPLKTAKCFFKLDIELFYADYNNHLNVLAGKSYMYCQLPNISILIFILTDGRMRD